MTFSTDIQRALGLIQKNKITQITPGDPFYRVRGRTSEYLTTNNFCSCEHFIHRCLKSKPKLCYHILAIQYLHTFSCEQGSDDAILNLLLRTRSKS